MKVLKFGGTSVGSPQRMQDVSKLITDDGQSKIVVLSAMSGTTNTLVEISDYLYKKNPEGANTIINLLEQKYAEHVDKLYRTEEVKQKTAKFLHEEFDYLRSFTKVHFTSFEEKVILAQKQGLKVIFCIGESKEERIAGKQNEVVKAELEGSVFNLSEEDFRKIVIAYEPIWAIGTGKTASAEQAEEIHAYIRSIIAEKYGQAVADDTTILYGGSCKASNAPELFAKPDIDGGLIGGASLKAADFKGIIDAWKK